MNGVSYSLDELRAAFFALNDEYEQFFNRDLDDEGFCKYHCPVRTKYGCTADITFTVEERDKVTVTRKVNKDLCHELVLKYYVEKIRSTENLKKKLAERFFGE